jgi:hypothetical protein
MSSGEAADSLRRQKHIDYIRGSRDTNVKRGKWRKPRIEKKADRRQRVKVDTTDLCLRRQPLSHEKVGGHDMRQRSMGLALFTHRRVYYHLFSGSSISIRSTKAVCGRITQFDASIPGYHRGRAQLEKGLSLSKTYNATTIAEYYSPAVAEFLTRDKKNIRSRVRKLSYQRSRSCT